MITIYTVVSHCHYLRWRMPPFMRQCWGLQVGPMHIPLSVRWDEKLCKCTVDCRNSPKSQTDKISCGCFVSPIGQILCIHSYSDFSDGTWGSLFAFCLSYDQNCFWWWRRLFLRQHGWWCFADDVGGCKDYWEDAAWWWELEEGNSRDTRDEAAETSQHHSPLPGLCTLLYFSYNFACWRGCWVSVWPWRLWPCGLITLPWSHGLFIIIIIWSLSAT